MLKTILILLGGALGTGCRYGLTALVNSVIKQPGFPYANLLINVSGSFIFGWLAEMYGAQIFTSAALRAALLTGVLGGYTTFSSFSFETYELVRTEAWLAASANALGSVLLGVIAVWAGVRLARAF